MHFVQIPQHAPTGSGVLTRDVTLLFLGSNATYSFGGWFNALTLCSLGCLMGDHHLSDSSALQFPRLPRLYHGSVSISSVRFPPQVEARGIALIDLSLVS